MAVGKTNEDDVFPISGEGPSLNELLEMEGAYVFLCADCEEVFETVTAWGHHAIANHKGMNPGVEPIRKQ